MDSRYCTRKDVDSLLLQAYIWPPTLHSPLGLWLGRIHCLLGYYGHHGLCVPMPSYRIRVEQEHTRLLHQLMAFFHHRVRSQCPYGFRNPGNAPTSCIGPTAVPLSKSVLDWNILLGVSVSPANITQLSKADIV